MRNFWLDRKIATSEVCKWDFQTEIGDKIKKKFEKQYVKVLQVENISPASQRRWKRLELMSQQGVWLIYNGSCSCGAWEKTVERPDCGVPLPTATVHEPKEEPKEDVVLPPWNTNSDLSGYDLADLPPWNTETYGWDYDL